MATLTYSRLEGVFVMEVEVGSSAFQQHCLVIMPHQGPCSGQGTVTLFNICKLLITEDSAP